MRSKVGDEAKVLAMSGSPVCETAGGQAHGSLRRKLHFAVNKQSQTEDRRGQVCGGREKRH